MRYLRENSKPNVKMGPPWLRTVSLNPQNMQPVSEGQLGLLRHYDLANVESIFAIDTEDIGLVRGNKLILAGRSHGAPGRGCSLTIEEMMDNI